jgi:hypothetical protein
MFSYLKNKILQVNRSTGIEIFVTANGEYIINAVEIIIRKGQVVKEREYYSKSIDELAKNIPLSNPVALTITGKAVLIKKITAAEFSGNYFDSFFPNANPNDFHVSFNRMGESVWIYLIRKNILTDISARLIDRGFKLLFVSAGPPAIENLIPFIDIKNLPAIKTFSHLIKLEKRKESIQIEISELTSEEDSIEYNIGNQYLKSSILLSFATALYLVTSDISDLPVLDDSLKEERVNFMYSLYFKKTGWAAMICLLVLLLSNFLIYNHYFKLNQEQQISENLLKTRLMDEREYQEKFNTESEFLKETGWDQLSRVSYFADRIASLVPENTMLTNMEIYPMKESLFQGEGETHFKLDTVFISGNCDDPENLAVFLGNLKNSIMVESVSIKDYSYKKEKEKGYFKMEIITKR